LTTGCSVALLPEQTTGCSVALLPEQMGVWSQPQQHDTPDATSCNLVNAMLGRIHQSGFLPVLSPESFAQVRNGISVYKQEIRSHIPTLTPFYPLACQTLWHRYSLPRC
jgi:alpha-galactosidase